MKNSTSKIAALAGALLLAACGQKEDINTTIPTATVVFPTPPGELMVRPGTLKTIPTPAPSTTVPAEKTIATIPA